MPSKIIHNLQDEMLISWHEFIAFIYLYPTSSLRGIEVASLMNIVKLKKIKE